MSELETTTSSEPAKKRWYVLQAFSVLKTVWQ